MLEVPRILPTAESPGLFWSVMIPTYNPRADYLEQTLRSVLAQDPGTAQMQVEVVDDCSPDVEVETIVKSIAGERVVFSKTPRNLGLAGCWNTCIECSRGQWVHILHQDDYILPGFYQLLAKAAACHPEVGLMATRSLFVEPDGVISGVSPRLKTLEKGGHTVDDFLYETPVQCPGVVVKRRVYEMNGGFRLDLKYVLDCEMWARLISSAGGLVTPEALSCYRQGSNGHQSESQRLCRTGESLRDLELLNQLFAKSYPEFDSKKGSLRLCSTALYLAEHYSKIGDSEAVKVNMKYWKKYYPSSLRVRLFFGRLARSIIKG